MQCVGHGISTISTLYGNGLALPRLWPRQRPDDSDVRVQGVSAPGDDMRNSEHASTAANGDVLMDTRRCKKCGADIEETFTTRTCQGCGIEESDCECEEVN